jgi:hypothetical protein
MRKRKVYWMLLVSTLLILFSCNYKKTNNQKAIARVYNKNLYITDIKDIFPQGVSQSDSLQILTTYVDRWVRKQLMLHRAQKNLTEEQKNVTQQLEDYRSSLLIFKYEHEYIRQKLDTIIPYHEIERFYDDNNANFILSESIVKALFIKINLDDPYYERIKGLYRSTKEEDIKNLDNLAYQVAVKYDYFNDRWIPFSRIVKELPEPITNPENFLINNRFIEVNDGVHAYLIHLREVIHRGQVSPISFEYENIKSILLNKRRQRLIIDLESKIYNDARNYNHLTIYLD